VPATLTRVAPVSLQLPDPTRAPNYRRSLTDDSDFVVRDLAADGWVSVEPGEGSGQTRQYFEAHRICDAQTALSDATWQVLRDHAAWEDHDLARRQRLLDLARDLARIGTPEATLQALQAGIAGAVNDAPAFLTPQLPQLFQSFPDGSLWLISTDRRFLSRLTFMRSRYAVEVTPDIHIDRNAWLGLRALDGHSLTGGVSFQRLFIPLLLTFSPGAIGYAFPWNPHVLVFLFGMSAELRETPPQSFASLYEPDTDVAAGDVSWVDPAFWGNLNSGDLESMLAWWTRRLNVLYSHATDPTRFESVGRHDAAGQFAWFLTLERMIADATLILSGPQMPNLSRLQAAFDLLDKAEALLGYGARGSGDGFKRLLRRSQMVPRLEAAWEQLPLRLRQRFRLHTTMLFDAIYDHVREHALSYRLTPKAVKVWRPESNRLVARPMDTYVPDLIRSVRNSAHGFLEVVADHDRYLIATHDGHLPPAVSDIAALIMFGLVADAEHLVQGNWF
jgi:hypothetical protein